MAKHSRNISRRSHTPYFIQKLCVWGNGKL